EYMKTPSHVEYMAFPRMIALSEVLWTASDRKDYSNFSERLGTHLTRLDKQNVNYRIPEPAGLENKIIRNEGTTTIALNALRSGSKIYYSLDGSVPDESSRAYDAPVRVELNPGEMKEIKTIVVTPTGRKSQIYAATLLRRELLPPAEAAERKSGVKYSMLGFKTGTDAEIQAVTGETKSILLNQFANAFDLKQRYEVTYEGFLKVPTDGIYALQVDSTWDATVFLAGEKIIDDVGTKDRKVRWAILPLKAGPHQITLRYNHRGGDADFRFRWGIKGQGLNQAYGGEFVH
ncbi:MAG: FN3 associated domain-containing protein, partial [Pyrinomonadaceae bacterium]